MAESIRGINIVIGAETTGLSKALSDVNKKSKDIQSELKQVEKLLKLDPKNTELLAQKQQLLNDAVENTREKLNKLRDAQAQVNEQFARGEINEGQYRAFQREVAKTEQELGKLEKQLREMEPAAKSFAKRMEEAGDKLKKTGDKISGVGTKLTKGVTAPLMAAGAGMVAVGAQFDDAFDKIRVGTGATGEALEALNEDFRQVARDVPASFDDISTAIADYNTRLGISGESLQDLSKQTLELVRVTGGDLAKTIEETSQSFQAFNLPAEEFGDALDFIFKTAQSTGIGIDRLQSNMVRFAPALKQLGFGFRDSATLLGQLDKAGVDVEQTLSGLTRAVANLAKEGIDDANEAIQILFDEIKNAPNDLAGTEAALKTFGNRAGPALASAIREGKLEYQDLLAELSGSEETILGVAAETKDWTESLVELKNSILLALEPLAGQFFEAINGLIPLVQSFVGWIANLIEWFINLPDGVQKTIGVIAGLVAAIGPVLVVVGKLVSGIGALAPVIGALANPVGLIIAAIAGLVTGLTILYNKNETFRNAINAAWEWLKDAAMAIFGMIKDFWDKWGEDILAAFQNVFGIVKTVFETVFKVIWEVIKFIFDAIKDFWDKWGGTITEMFKNVFEILKIIFESVFKVIKTIVTTAFNWIKSFWDTWGETITIAFRTIFNVVRSIFEGAWNVIKTVIETVIGVISNLIKGFLAVLKGDWEGAWNAVKGIVESIWNGIKNLFGSIWETMKNVGKDIIQGLIDGISSMAKAVWDKVNEISDGIKNAVKGFFGISSPSKLMLGFGEDIGEGLAIGLQRSVSAVKKQVDALNAAATPEITVGANGGGSAGGGFRTADIRIYLDGRELAAELGAPLVDQIRMLTGVRT